MKTIPVRANFKPTQGSKGAEFIYNAGFKAGFKKSAYITLFSLSANIILIVISIILMK